MDRRFGSQNPDERIAPGGPVFASPGVKRPPLTLAQRAALMLAALACAALAAFSFTCLFQEPQGSQENLLNTVAQEQQAQDGADAAKSSAGEKPQKTEGKKVKKAKAGKAQGQTQDAKGADASAQEQTSPSAKGSSPSSQKGSSSAGKTGGSSASSASGNGGGSNAAATKPSSGGQSSQQPAPAPVPSTVTVHVSVSSSAVGNPVSVSTTLTFQKGATVYDALCGTGLSINSSATAYGVYVAAIGGLAEKEHGAMSGWTYYVNGVYANKSCSAYALSDGDSISWVYVTG